MTIQQTMYSEKLTVESLIDMAPPITEACDTSAPAFRDYQEEVVTWFDRSDDYASIDAEARAQVPAALIGGSRNAR